MARLKPTNKTQKELEAMGIDMFFEKDGSAKFPSRESAERVLARWNRKGVEAIILD